MWKKIARILIWSVSSIALGILFIAAMQKKEDKKCKEVKVNLTDVHAQAFIDKEDILYQLRENGVDTGAVTSTINLKIIESNLEKDAWIKKADLFFDNNQILHVNIQEREPVARIFTLSGTSYYIDSSCNRMPLTDKFFAGVPMFTSFPSSKSVLSRPDSLVLTDIKNIGQYIKGDSFWMAQTAQVDVTAHRKYEIIPVIGDQVIKIGDAQNLEDKFSAIMAFYKLVWSKTGINKYAVIDAQYKNQVVAVKAGTKPHYSDTAKAMNLFGNTLSQIKSVLNDTAFAIAESKSFKKTKQENVNKKNLTKTTKDKENEKKKKGTEALKKNNTAENKAEVITEKKVPKAIMKKQTDNR